MSILPSPLTQIIKYVDNFSPTVNPAPYFEPVSFKCVCCHQTFQDSNTLKKHMILHAAENLYPCSTCNKNFKSKHDCNKHNNIHTGKKSYVCIVCHETYKRSYVLKLHMKVYTTRKPYTCITCYQSFKNKKTCDIHQNKHTKNYFCNICEKSFVTFYSLKRHKKAYCLKRSVSGMDNASSQNVSMQNLKKTRINRDEVSHTESENILPQKENVKVNIQNINGKVLPRGYTNQSISDQDKEESMHKADAKLPSFSTAIPTISPKVTIASLDNSPYTMETQTKIDSRDEYLDKSVTGVNLYQTGGTHDAFRLQTESSLHVENSFIDLKKQLN